MAGNQSSTARVVRESRINQANGVPGLDNNGVMSENQLPSNIKKISPDADAFKDWNRSGSGAPTGAPLRVGSSWTDTTNGDFYIARSTSSAADWVKVGSTGGSATDPQWYGTQSAYDSIASKDANTTYNIVPA